MRLKQALAALTLTGIFGMLVPAAPVMANGAASTRNILLGIGAATYLIIQHNRKVHEKYAEDARRQAALEQQNNDAWAAYHQEQRAYDEEVAVNQSLKREIAYQHQVVTQQQRQLAALNVRASFARPVAAAPSSRGGTQQVAMTSYGWGDI